MDGTKKINVGPGSPQGEQSEIWRQAAMCHRMLTAAMIYVLRCGCPRRALPHVFGPWQTVYSRWRLWCGKGDWTAAVRSMSRHQTGVLRFVDASHLKVHQDAGSKDLDWIDSI